MKFLECGIGAAPNLNCEPSVYRTSGTRWFCRSSAFSNSRGPVRSTPLQSKAAMSLVQVIGKSTISLRKVFAISSSTLVCRCHVQLFIGRNSSKHFGARQLITDCAFRSAVGRFPQLKYFSLNLCCSWLLSCRMCTCVSISVLSDLASFHTIDKLFVKCIFAR